MAFRHLSTLGVATALTLAAAGSASAYVGPSFLEIPGIAGGWHGEKYKNWIQVEAQYWEREAVGINTALANTGNANAGRRGNNAANANANRNRLRGTLFPAPSAPREGAGQMVVSLDKKSPVTAKLMDACVQKTKVPELTYAESASSVARAKGLRPTDMPEYFEYKLKDVQLDCPVLAAAPEQAFVLKFNDIQWLNYQGQGGESVFEPKKLRPAVSTGATRAFVVHWMGMANDVSDDQCPIMNSKPLESDYYALLSKDEAAKERARLGEKGVSYENGQMEKRGPNKLNVCKLPGIVTDAGHVAPVSKAARGINLDGNDGTGAAPADTCKHPNFVSADGKQSGIDNQLYTVLGCAPAYMGHKGFYWQYANEQRRNGSLAILLEITGIDDEKNDDSIELAILYSLDHMAKDATGQTILGDYTFRVTDEPAYTHYFTQLKGRIVDGVVTTEPVDVLRMNGGYDIEMAFHQGRMRLELLPNGAMKGVVGGYIDWRSRMEGSLNSNLENLYGYKCPGLYHAYQRAADGLKDPVTGKCNGISAAWDIEAVPAFIPPGQRKSLVASADASR